MPSWKKVITSGSDATLTSVTATAGFTGSLLGTASYATNAISASYATTASYAANGGVTQLLAGSNVTLSPTNGLGQVTVSATLSGSTSFNTATGSYGSFYDTTTQTNPVANIARSMSFNSTDITNGVSISGSTNPFNTYIKTENAGIYNIQFSAQLDKTDSGADEIVIWLRKNGIDLTDTATTLTLSGNNDKQVAAWNWFVTSATGDYYQIIWISADIDLRLLAEPISGTHPGIPSVIATVNRVDQFLSNTGSFSGSFTGNLIGTASYATQALSASYAPGGGNPFPFNGNAQISGSLGVTGSFTTQTFDGLNYVNAISIGNFSRAIYDVMGTSSFDADGRDLYDSNTILSTTWEGRRLVDTVGSQSVNWNDRLLKIDNGPGAFTVNWGGGILQDTGSNNSVDWQNRITIDTGTKTSIDWQNRKLKNSSGNENLNWGSGVSITGSLTVSGSSTFTNIGPAQFSGSFVVQGAGDGFTGPFKAIEIDDANFSRQLFDTSAGIVSIDFGNRSLNTAVGGPAISWQGGNGTYQSNLYESQYIDSTTRNNVYGFNALAGQVLDESYLDATVSNDELVYLNTDGLWYQVDQTTDTSTKMLGIAKNINSQTGSVFIEGDITVTTGAGYPLVAGANYGLPIYIKEGNGIAMSTTIPTTGYVRLLGYCYHYIGGSSEWIMKFRPSNEWIEL